ncbi:MULTISPECIES: hypothetical protein [unclassified Amycolatopsis]|uniref:hypothetical protein n=1 Tax=unclassified Amycolatopsis TaxID=2618356 RepID=UPI001C6A4F62|nr:hypothetical protein [Amycolatopsis sp. DSM 110486]QYN20150.1 hypothetical protein K1T34_47680 [Amycolatopsis sp. DSM 110486]
MSPNNHATHGTASVATTGRHLRAVPQSGQDNMSNAESKVLAALIANPDSTSATLAKAAQVGRSTAGKILARWDHEGRALRTSGGDKNSPGTWKIAPTASPEPAVGPIDKSDASSATETDDGPVEADDHAPPVTAVSSPGDGIPVSSPLPSTDSDSTTPLPVESSGGPADGSTTAVYPAGNAPADSTGDGPTTNGRLPKGALRALVQQYLTDRPGQDFGPAKIGKELGHSGGAVNNALEKLAADGYAFKTCEAPKRFTINPGKTDVTQPAIVADDDKTA